MDFILGLTSTGLADLPNPTDSSNSTTATAIATAPNATVDLLAFAANPYADFNITDIFGPPRDPLYVVIPITCIYVAIFITGVVGNISTCIVISRNRSMHTATNYYLFSLAVSDFLLLIAGVPQEMYLIWSKYPYVFGEVFCVMRGMMAEASANATVLTITAFTVERYVAICHPFLSHTMSKLSRAIRLIVGVWAISIFLAIPQALQFGVITVAGQDQCGVTRVIIEHSFELSTFVFFVGPMSLITVLYVLIGLKLRSASLMPRANGATLQRRAPQSSSLRQQTSQGTRRVLKMLVAVVVAFFLCWAPFHAQRLVAIYGSGHDHLNVYVVMTYISGILYYLSTCINPLLYNLMSNKFREAFKETLAACCHPAARADNQKRAYRVLSRGQRAGRTGRLESTDYSGSSLRDESHSFSTATHKQSIDSQMTASPAHPAASMPAAPPISSGASHGGASHSVCHSGGCPTTTERRVSFDRCTITIGSIGAGAATGFVYQSPGELALAADGYAGRGADLLCNGHHQCVDMAARLRLVSHRRNPSAQSAAARPTAQRAWRLRRLLRRLPFWRGGGGGGGGGRGGGAASGHTAYYSPPMEGRKPKRLPAGAGRLDFEEALLETLELPEGVRNGAAGGAVSVSMLAAIVRRQRRQQRHATSHAQMQVGSDKRNVEEEEEEEEVARAEDEISNSSLTDAEPAALGDELAEYMADLRRRELG